jgi:hypothetical protein
MNFPRPKFMQSGAATVAKPVISRLKGGADIFSSFRWEAPTPVRVAMASYCISRMHFLLMAGLRLFISADVRAEPLAGAPWTKVRSVVIVAKGGDLHPLLVHAAVAHWNSVLAGIGTLDPS